MKSTRIIALASTLLITTLAAFAQDPKQTLNDQLWEAARSGDTAAVTALLDKGADVNAKFRYGTTTLFKAAERGNAEVVKILLARGADVTVKDTFYGATAMTWALQNDHIEVVRALLEKDTGSVNDVLMTGARDSKPALVQLALEKGGAKAETMTSALAAAQSDKEHPEIAEMLKKAGAQPPFELDAATRQSYLGKYKPEQGGDIVVSLQDGKLFATPTGQRSFAMMAVDKTTLKPVGFDGIVVNFSVDGDKVVGFTLKQGANTTTYKKVE